MRIRIMTVLLLLAALLTSCVSSEKPVDRSYLIEAYVPSAVLKKTEQLVLDTTETTDSPTGQTVTQAVPEGSVVQVLEDRILTDDEIAEVMQSLDWNVMEGTGSAEIIAIGSDPQARAQEQPAADETPAPEDEQAALPAEQEVHIMEDDIPETEETDGKADEKKDPSMTGDQWTDMSADLSKTISEQSSDPESAEITVPGPVENPQPLEEEASPEQEEIRPVVIAETPQQAQEDMAPVQEEGNQSASAEHVEADQPEPVDRAYDSLSEKTETQILPEDGIPFTPPESAQPAAAEPAANGLRRTLSAVTAWVVAHHEVVFVSSLALMAVLLVVLLASGRRSKGTIAKRGKSKRGKQAPGETGRPLGKKETGFRYKADSWNVVMKTWPED